MRARSSTRRYIVYNTIYYKEVSVVTGDMDETLIVTYSPKYNAYQRKIRVRQIERAERIITTPGRKRKGKSQNDPMRFVKKTSVTTDGEIAEKQVYDLDEKQIQKEEMYDGFYADPHQEYKTDKIKARII